MLISIISPAFNEPKRIQTFLSDLDRQAGNFEVIVVGLEADIPKPLDHRVRFVSGSKAGYAAQLHTGAFAAEGDVLFFLDPATQLPPDALLAIQRNLKLLPNSIGGNFHLKFSQSSLLARFLAAILKRQRYQGCYYFNSGIFIRRQAYQAIGGIRPEVKRPELDFVRRMERYGPTLYLPEAIIAPLPAFQEVCQWLITPILRRWNINNVP